MRSPRRGPCWTAAGNLRRAGLLPSGSCPSIAGRTSRPGPSRIKEWDYYLVANDHFAVALTIDDNGYMGLDSISSAALRREAGSGPRVPCAPFPWGKTGLPETRLPGAPPPSPVRSYAPGPSAMCQGADRVLDFPHGGFSGRRRPSTGRIRPDGRAGGVHGHLHAL